MNAHAYTVGSNIVFQRDKYDPGSDAGRTMIAHELTHVVQQRSGPVDGTATGTGVRVSDPSDRFEREAAATAERAMSAPALPLRRRSASRRAPPSSSAMLTRTQPKGALPKAPRYSARNHAARRGRGGDRPRVLHCGRAVQRDEAEEEEPG